MADARWLKLGDVCRLVSCGKSWWLQEVREGRAPQPVRIGTRFVRWRESDVAAWMASK